MSNPGYLGIDPGLKGALVLYRPGTDLIVFDVPTISRKVGKSIKPQIDAYQIGNWLDLYRQIIKRAIIEQVGSMPEQGITSAFNFGFTTGCLHGLLAGNKIPMATVLPQVWKRAYGLIGQDKDASRQAASRLAPQYAHHWPLKKHDGRAEAFLMALFGSQHG